MFVSDLTEVVKVGSGLGTGKPGNPGVVITALEELES